MEKGIDHLANAVSRRCGASPFDLAVILGSGLGSLVDQVEKGEIFPYGDYGCFPKGAVAGHAGRLVAGTLRGWRVLLFQGRFHLYQGLTAGQTVLPVRVAHRLGCRRLLLTNAVGGIHDAFVPGDFMFIDDHLNLLGENPLRGLTENPFLDLTSLYLRELFPPLLEHARSRGIGLHSGVLAAVQGPSYETPAEIRMLKALGADAVSMSSVPEAIMARYLDMEVAGLSFIANRAAGLGNSPLSHPEVLAAGERGGTHLSILCERLIDLWRERQEVVEVP